MLYDNYQKRINRIAEILAHIVRHLPKIIAALATILAIVVTLLATKGIVGKVSCPGELSYGDALEPQGKAFLSSIWYEYCEVGSTDWNEEKPEYPGRYQVRGVANASFGKIRYGKPVDFTIIPRAVDVAVADARVTYGELPRVTAPLVGGDRLVCEGVLYADVLATNTTVRPDTSAVKVFDSQGNDITFAYQLHALDTPIAIDPRPVDLTVQDASLVYDGTAFTYQEYEITGGSLAQGDQIQVTFPQSLTDVGQVPNTPQITVLNSHSQVVTHHYQFTEHIGQLVVEHRPLLIVVEDYEATYTGEPHKSTAYSVDASTPLANGHQLEVVSASEYVDCGTHVNRLVFRVLDANGRDVTANHTIVVKEGQIKITPRALHIFTGTQSWVYDGQAHTWEDLTEYGLVDGQIIRVQNAPSITDVGTLQNKYTVEVYAQNKNVTANYEITYEYGTLEVMPRALLIRTATASWIYDAQSHVNIRYQIIAPTALVKGHNLIPRDMSTITTVGKIENVIAYTIHSGKQDVTKNYNVSYVFGTLEVHKRPVTIQTNSATWVYDGQPHREVTYQTTSTIKLVDGHTLKTETYAEITEVGTKQNLWTGNRVVDEKGEDVSENYALTIRYGTLHISPRPIICVVLDTEKIYDDTPLQAGEVIVSPESPYQLVQGHSLSATASGSRTDAGESPSVIGKVKILDGKRDVTHNYEISKVDGKIIVKPRPILIETGSATKRYDKLPLTNKTYQLSKNSPYPLVKGHQLTAIPIGSQTEIGESENRCAEEKTTIMAQKRNVTANYAISYQYGMLVVKPYAIVSVITASDWKYYDGKPLTNHTYEEYVLEGEYASGHRLVVEITGTITEIGKTPNEATARVYNRYHQDVSEYYTINLTLGELEVRKRQDGGSGGDGELDSSLDQDLSSGESPDTVVMEIRSGKSEHIYLKVASYGSYTGKDWTDAKAYPKLLDDTYSYNYLSSYILSRSSVGATPLEIKRYTKNYPLPYFVAMGEYDYQIQTNDAMNAGDSDMESTLCYYSIDTSNISAYLGNVGNRQSELEAYSKFVYSEYTDVDPQTRQYMQRIISKNNFNRSDPNIIKKVAEYIQNAATYNLKYNPKLNEEANIAVAFLDKYKEGVCVHYASAATLLYRTLGFAARYTVGFTGDTEAGEWTQIKTPGHAWVELYIDGFGWIPVEVTGGDGAGGGGGGGGGGGTVFGKIKADQSTTLYLKQQSFGDYDGRGWGEAVKYTKMLPGGYSYNYLTSFALKNSGLTMHVAEIIESTLYMLPYYLGEEGSYEKPKDDVINASDMPEYTMSYYSFPKIAKYYDQVMGNLGEYAPYEAEYRKFVHQVYTKVDSETRAYMEKIIKEKGFKKNDPAVITKIAEYIQNAADYNLQYDKAMDQEHNVAIAFLDTYKEGICVHYATAATLLYRSLGIPARYVHGFAIETRKNDYVDIKNPGHAWVEVYIDGLGWISVEVTGTLFELPEEKTFNMKLKFGEPRYIEIAPRFNIKPYDGKTLYPTGELDVSPLLADLLKEGYTYTCKIEGSQRNVGTSQTTITDFKIFDPKGKDVTERFIVVKKTGLLEVIPSSQKLVRVYLYQVQKYYDGEALTFRSDDYEVLAMDNGLRLSLSLKMSMLNAGYLSLSDINTHLSDYVSYQVYKGNSNVTKSYRLVFDVMSGTDPGYIPMRVDPRPLELTTASVSKVFDGKPLFARSITISGGKLCKNDSLFAIVDTELEDIGKAPNMIEQEPFMIRNQDGINVTYNYDITVSPGILEIIAGPTSSQK